MNIDDWRALLESYLAGEADAEEFKEQFIESWKAAREEGSKVPKVIGDFFYSVENFNPEDDDDSDLRDDAQKALDKLAELS